MKNTAYALVAVSSLLAAIAGTMYAEDAKPDDLDLASDLKVMQGSWELLHGGQSQPTTRSVKTIAGNTETLRRYNAKTGKQTHEHSVEFKLSKSGSVRVLTFYRPGGSPENGLSYVYKLDKDNFWDIPGLLVGGEFRNYQDQPTIWHWKRIVENAPATTDIAPAAAAR